MCHFYFPCFDYIENCFFFLQVIQTHVFVSEGDIKFDKKAKVQVLQTFEGIFYASFTYHWPEESFTCASSRFCKMKQSVRPFICWCSITFSSKRYDFQNDTNCPIPHIWTLHQTFVNDTNRPPFIYACLRRFVLKC